MYTKSSRLSLKIGVVYIHAMDTDMVFDRTLKLIDKGYKAIDARIARLPSNRVDDFPGTSRYELCENDSEIEVTENGDASGSIEVYGEGDWATEHVAKEVKALFVEEFEKLADDFGASITVTEVSVIQEVVTKVISVLDV